MSHFPFGEGGRRILSSQDLGLPSLESASISNQEWMTPWHLRIHLLPFARMLALPCIFPLNSIPLTLGALWGRLAIGPLSLGFSA